MVSDDRGRLFPGMGKSRRRHGQKSLSQRIKEMKKETEKLTLFGRADLKKLIGPLIMEQLLTVMVGMADSLMVSSVGEAAVSAVSLCDGVNWLLIMFFTSIATGGAVVAGQALGMKHEKRACEAANQLILAVFSLSLLVMALMYLGKNLIIHGIFGSIAPDVARHCNTYYMIVTASIPFIALYNAGAALYRTMGNSAVTMKISLLMNVINVCGNGLLIFGFHMEVAGVAIPTLVSRAVAAAVILTLLHQKSLTLHLHSLNRIRPQWGVIRQIFSIGIPNGVENSMFQLGKIILLSLIAGFGTAATAANAVGTSLGTFEILPGTAIGYALVTVVSRCVGAGDYEQVKGYTRLLLKWIVLSHLLVNGLMLLALNPVLSLYNLSPEAHNMTRELMLWHTVMAIWLWPLSFSLPNTLRASGDVRFTMGISVVSMWLCRCLMGYVLGKTLGLGVLGVWLAMFSDWVFRSAFFLIRYHGKRWQHQAIS